MSLKNTCPCMLKPTGGKLQEQEGVTNRGEHFAASRNKEGYHSMLYNPGEHSAASYFKDTLDTSPSLHVATSVAK